MSIKVVIADDHIMVREGMRSLLKEKTKDIVIIGEASDGNDVLELSKKIHPDLYVLDIAMRNLNGLETAKRLIKRAKNSKIILLSMHDNRTFIEQALNIGVKGYVLKESAIDDIIKAIREVHRGGFYLTPRISTYVIRDFLERTYKGKKDSFGTKLTAREREVLQLISEGCSNKDIAKKLDRSINTIHVHRNSIMQKLDIHNQAELVRYALKEGISHL